MLKFSVTRKTGTSYVVLSQVLAGKGVYSRMQLPTDMDLYRVPQVLIEFLDNCHNN